MSGGGLALLAGAGQAGEDASAALRRQAMSPIRHENERRVPIESWGGYVERTIREAQERGEFDNLPGAGKPLDLEENPFAGEWQSAFRIAKNAGAVPLWVELDREIRAGEAALTAMVERTARYLAAEVARLSRMERGAGAAPRRRVSWWRRLLFGPPRAGPGPGRAATLVELEAERRRARARYLEQVAELNGKILDFNSRRPRQLGWLDKPRLPAEIAARRFDERCPPVPAEPVSRPAQA
jgi:hypothetical protein